MGTPDVRGEIVTALTSLRADADELAYFALTSKPEFQIRDRLAYKLHRSFAESHPELRVAREWMRVDLAVLRGTTPIALLEAKAMTSYNLLDEKRAKHYRDQMLSDRAKAAKSGPGADVYLLMIVPTTPGSIPRDLHDVVKYGRRLREVSDDEMQEAFTTFSKEIGTPEQIRLGKGEVFGVTTELLLWLYGPEYPESRQIRPQATTNF